MCAPGAGLALLCRVSNDRHDGVRALCAKGEGMKAKEKESPPQAQTQVPLTQLDVGALLFCGGQKKEAKEAKKGRKK